MEMSEGLEVSKGTDQDKKVAVKILKKEEEEQQQLNSNHTKQAQTTKLINKSKQQMAPAHDDIEPGCIIGNIVYQSML